MSRRKRDKQWEKQVSIQRQEVADRIQQSKDRMGKRGRLCEGTLFADHLCTERHELNEVSYPRNRFQSLKRADQRYFFHEINCALNCQFFHATYGHRTKYREWHMKRVIVAYGREAVKKWHDEAPLTPEGIIRVPNADNHGSGEG